MRKVIGGIIVVAGLFILLNTCITWLIGISARAQSTSTSHADVNGRGNESS